MPKTAFSKAFDLKQEVLDQLYWRIEQAKYEENVAEQNWAIVHKDQNSTISQTASASADYQAAMRVHNTLLEVLGDVLRLDTDE